jgi:mannose-6-phosphate isomerase class I
MDSFYRKTSQFLMPAVKPEAQKDKYDIYPGFHIGDEKIFRGMNSLIEKIAGENIVILDGFSGILFDQLKSELQSLLSSNYNIAVQLVNVHDFMKSEDQINKVILPFLGGEDPLFGTRTTLSIKDFFDEEKLHKFQLPDSSSHTIIYGAGASLVMEGGFMIYVDLPKNELQYRSLAGTVTNLGATKPCDPKSMYKRFYFVDWVIHGKHKLDIIDRIDIFIDGQRAEDITWLTGYDFRKSLHDISRSVVRTRPWFEPGPWGGTWIKKNITGINPEVPNYAWSFELITPENGLIIESSGLMVEFSFDFLMFQEARAVLGDSFKRFGTDFPIRFDFLDTFDGGNLSIQCHPRPKYMKENFGENFTQEEAYYILDTKDDADVYLGFQENVDKEELRTVLKKSFIIKEPVNIEKFVQKHSSHKHDLFLIPYGTIHGSGRNNLVLEISSTPYIFTFKMYDWLRPDLNGEPRPLNIDRGMDNLYFDRKGDSVVSDLISKPVILEEGIDWKLFHLPTHPSHLYDVIRYHFTKEILVCTMNKFHVLNLVEGNRIIVEISDNKGTEINYAETFIIPASIVNYRVTNLSNKPAILIIAYVKDF